MYSNFLLILCFSLFVPGYISEAAKSGTQELPACRIFTLEELKEATKNFDMSSLLGEGFRGKVLYFQYFVIFFIHPVQCNIIRFLNLLFAQVFPRIVQNQP